MSDTKEKIIRNYTIEDLEELLDKLPYQIWLKDDEKKYIYINKLGAEKLGISKEEIIGKTDYEFREYDIAKECDKTDIEVIEKKADIYNEEYSKIDDNEIWHKVYKFILHKENKKEIIGGVAREISLDKNVQLEIESNLMSYLNIHEEKRYDTKKTIHLLLKEIKNTEPEYSEAKKLLSLLEYFESVPSEYVPTNSLLREFIGGSIFYEK